MPRRVVKINVHRVERRWWGWWRRGFHEMVWDIGFGLYVCVYGGVVDMTRGERVRRQGGVHFSCGGLG